MYLFDGLQIYIWNGALVVLWIVSDGVDSSVHMWSQEARAQPSWLWFRCRLLICLVTCPPKESGCDWGIVLAWGVIKSCKGGMTGDWITCFWVLACRTTLMILMLKTSFQFWHELCFCLLPLYYLHYSCFLARMPSKL